MPDPQADMIQTILGYARRIAVVGLSDNPHRASFGVAEAMRARGYEIVPVNPRIEVWNDLEVYPTLADVPGTVDVVDVFRREEHLVGCAEEAVAIGARALWLQLGLESDAAMAMATSAGLDAVEDRCLKVEIARYAREMDLPPAA